MSGFTKGKWVYDKHYGCIHHDGKLIAEVAGAGGSNYRHAQGEANARLIAAAPEMYELLKVWTQIQAQPALMIAQENARKLLASIDGKEE